MDAAYAVFFSSFGLTGPGAMRMASSMLGDSPLRMRVSNPAQPSLPTSETVLAWGPSIPWVSA